MNNPKIKEIKSTVSAKDKQKNKKNNAKLFWWGFWIAICLLAVLSIVPLLYHHPKLQQNSQRVYTKKFIDIVKLKLPSINKIIDTDFSEKSMKEIEVIIDNDIDALFCPVYEKIPEYSDFHYSLTGEYSEMFQILSSGLYKSVKRRLFDSVNFEQNLSIKLNQILNHSSEIINKSSKIANSKISSELNLSNSEFMEFSNEFIKISTNDMKERFSNFATMGIRVATSIKGFSLGMAGTVLVKKICSKLTAKIIGKVVAKTGIKVGTELSGAGIGAGIGSIFGPAGTLIGGLIGGAITWFAVDKIIIEIDQYFNEEEFRDELRKLVDAYKNSMKNELKNIYRQALHKTANQLKDGYANIKSVPKLKDFIGKKHD
jgi:hypothetical protein